MTEENIWIEHDSGPCPVNHKTRVEVRFEDGTEFTSKFTTAGFWDGDGQNSNWDYRDGAHGIVAYRVVQP